MAEEILRAISEASRRLAVSKDTIRRLISSGNLRAVRVGKRVLVPESEIERACRQGCGAQAGNGKGS